jgi:hypothetical protein
MRQLIFSSSFVTLTFACGGVHSPLSEQRAPLSSASDAAAPASDAALQSPPATIKVRYPNPPPDLPSEGLHAALVWIDAPGNRPGPGDSIGVGPAIRSDVLLSEISTFELPVAAPPMPNLHKDYEGRPDMTQEQRDLEYHTLPIAEVVLYQDGNGNGVLDLLPLGESGPGPDRIIALSSGRDGQGNAKRIVVANKKNPLSHTNLLSALPGASSFLLPQPAHTSLGGRVGAFDDEGLYIVSIAVSADKKLAQEALLSGYVSRGSLVGSRADSFYYKDAVDEVEAASQGSVTLYTVDPKRASWLARGCTPHLLDNNISAPPLPPPGAAIQCGAGKLLYSTTADNYCGEVGGMMEHNWSELTTEPWPCGPRGLIEGTPYVASSTRLDGHVLLDDSRLVLTGDINTYLSADWLCDPHVLYDFDQVPTWRLPSIAPEPGSQIKCYSHESFSYIPPRADGCSFKYSYDLSSQYYTDWDYPLARWELRDQPPAWWPCDESGQLRADTPYEPAREPQGYGCRHDLPDVIDQWYPPPPNSQIHCLSLAEYQLRPLWADICDGSARVSQWGGSPMTIWPCDENGEFIARPGLSAY